MKNVKVFVLGALILLTIIVVAQNTQSVDTKILFVTLTMPRAVLLIVTFLAGAFVGMFSGLLRGRPAK